MSTEFIHPLKNTAKQKVSFGEILWEVIWYKLIGKYKNTIDYIFPPRFLILEKNFLSV